MKLCLHNITDHGPIDFSIHNAWNKKSVIKRANAIKVRAYVYQARDLPAADAEGTSDPYIKIWDTTCSGKKFKRTEVVEDNCNPLFYECIELDYEVTNYDDLNSYPPFIFDIFDHDDDLFDSTPDFMCRCIVEPEDCAILMEKDFELCKEHQ
jgi:Ca2+-dependent lipid-binding protein